MNYVQTVEWMFSRLPMFQNQGRTALNSKLDNILAFCNYLGNPHKFLKTIHIAGTNGKGSSSCMVASVLQQAGYKVGLYTSPHLKDFRERIKINGVEISENEVVSFVDAHRSFLEAHNLSFFEMTVGMAFYYFHHQKVDCAVIEVGLGGRWDSTNIIVPEVSLITNIGKDHQDILGDTLEKIAYEKAGIIKRGTPVVISEYQREVADVFKTVALQHNSKIVFASEEIFSSDVFASDLKGVYQSKNIKGVMVLFDILQQKGWNVSQNHLKEGLCRVTENTKFQGRWYKIGENPLIICDTAHNEPGINEVITQIKSQKYNRLHIVLGFVRDKDISSILQKFPKHAFYYFVSPRVYRGLASDELKQTARLYGLQGQSYLSVQEGLNAAKQNAFPDDFIYVGGSTFVVAEVVD